MSLWDKVVGIVNKRMNTEAQQILSELQAECPKDTGRTAASFHIAGKGEGGTVSVGAKGLIGSVQIISTELSAYYANYGNGGRNRTIYPTHAKALHLKDGSFRGSVRGYDGTHFVEKVANRHR